MPQEVLKVEEQILKKISEVNKGIKEEISSIYGNQKFIDSFTEFGKFPLEQINKLEQQI